MRLCRTARPAVRDLAVGLLITVFGAALSADIAEARADRLYRPQRIDALRDAPFYARPSSGRRPEARRAEPAAQPQVPGSPLIAVVSVAEQRVTVYGAEGLVAQSPVSTGQSGHRTPTGVFSVIQKRRYHESNIYSGAPMPYMQRITWSGIAMHQGHLPGYPASHGCIRLPEAFAQRWWAISKVGTRVIVAPHGASPVAITHSGLPAPRLRAAEGPVATVSPAAQPILVAADGASRPAADAEPARLLNPIERAQAAKLRASEGIRNATKAQKAALEQAQRAAAEARRIEARVGDLDRIIAVARGQIVAAEQAFDQAAGPAAADRASAIAVAAAERLERAEEELAELKAAEVVKIPEAFAAVAAMKEAESSLAAATAALRAATRDSEPISAFVSRKDARLYIRQGFEPVFDAPVVIRDRELPFGTHVYTAISASDGGKAVEWHVVTVPESSVVEEPRQSRSGRGTIRVIDPRIASHRETPSGALDRIEIPAEAREFIADRLWLGGSLVVSDHGASNETGRYTDFIVLTRQ